GFYLANDRALSLRALSRPSARNAKRRRESRAHEATGGIAHEDGAVAERFKRDRRVVKRILPRYRFSLPWPRHQFSNCAGRSIEAKRDFLHSRRRLSRGRNETRAQRADR